MTSDGSIKSRADKVAVPNAFGQPRVELSDIVTRVGCDPFRNPAVFAWYGQLGEFLLTTSSPSHIKFLPLHRGSVSGRQLEVALVPVDLEQEGRPSIHAAANLKGHDRTVSDNATADELVGGSLGDQFAAFLDRDAIALANDECGKLTKFAKAIAQRIDRMAASDRQEVGAIGVVGLIGTVDGGSPIRGTANHRRRQNSADVPIGDQVLGVVDRWRYLALQSDGMPDSLAVCCISDPGGFVGITAERPFAIDVLPGLDCGHDGQVVIGHLHADRDQIDIRMLSQLFGIAKRQRHPVMPCRCLCRILPRRTYSVDLEVRKLLQGRNMGDRCKPTARICPDNSYADISVRRHDCLPYLAASYRCTSSIMIPSGPRMKASRKPGLRVRGPIAISAPLARNSSTAA